MFRKSWWLVVLYALAASSVVRFSTAGDPPSAPAPDEESVAMDADEPEGTEALTRGPIHEAFANPVGEPEAGLIVEKEPPAAIEEVPPEYKPDGDDVAWIGGYWSWDDERSDFIWVSGVWRKTPPGQRWVPGNWNKVAEGWQWTSGFWAPDTDKEITYYSPPPETLEAGPSSEAPSDQHFWTPGVWNYYQTGYRWRPGFWTRTHPNWIWVPDRWAWTPGGAVFVPGYWDYTLATRGAIFTPVYFRPGVYSRPGFAWTPRYALNPAAMMVNFWIRPNYGHYYFGNFYGGNYNRWGYQPLGQYWGRPRGRGWDPIVAYNQTFYRGQGVNYVHQLNQWHQFYANNPNQRPPNTWREQATFIKNQNINVNNINNITNVTNIVNHRDINNFARNGGNNVVALPLQQFAKATPQDEHALRFHQVNQQQVQRAQERSRELRQVGNERAQLEHREAVSLKDNPLPNPDPKNAQVRHTMKLPEHVGRVNDDGDGPGRDRPDTKKPVGDRPTINDPRGDGPDKPDRPKVVTRPGANDDGDKPQRPNIKPPHRPNPHHENGATNGDDPKPRPNNKPGDDDPKPDRPKVDRPKIDRPEPKIDRPDPKPKVDRPEPKIDRPDPKPKVDRPDPKPKVDRPEPKIDRPDPKPKPKVDRPEPKVERPQPKREPPPKPNTKISPRPTAKPEGPKGNPRGKEKENK